MAFTANNYNTVHANMSKTYQYPGVRTDGIHPATPPLTQMIMDDFLARQQLTVPTDHSTNQRLSAAPLSLEVTSTGMVLGQRKSHLRSNLESSKILDRANTIHFQTL